MKYYSLLSFGLLSLGLVTGCSSHHDKKWYMQHDSERKAMIERCVNDAALRLEPDCQNAADAERRIRLFGNSDQTHNYPSPHVSRFH